MSDNLNKVTLVGLGAMAVEYANVLKYLKCEISAIGRSDNSCKVFTEKTGVKSFAGGVLKNSSLVAEKAIVAANVESLAEITLQLLEAGAKSILVEKPGALNTSDLLKIKQLADSKNAKVYIAYNRRFLASTLELTKRIQNEGGLQTGYFEFTEWSHVIDKLPDSPAKQTTFISNSTHVIDLAFYLMGKPIEMANFSAGTKMFNWNEGPSRFAGSGITENKVLFSYHANWTSAGRWGVEVLTKESRYILRPLEKLFRQPVGSVQIEEIPLTVPEDQVALKPGFYEQTKAFLNSNSDSNNKALVSLNEQIKMFEIYEKINRP